VRNPFLSSSQLNTRITLQAKQEIHFNALVRAMNSQPTACVPATVDVDQIGNRVQQFGWESCLTHPDDLEMIFAHVSTDIYELVRDLYCDLIGRSISMVDRIIRILAQVSGQPAPGYEAVWAICLHLDRIYAKRAVIRTAITDTIWHISSIQTRVNIVENGESYTPQILLLFTADDRPQVVSFEIAAHDNLQSALFRLLYEGIAAQRQPTPRETAGVVWHLPRLISVSQPIYSAINPFCSQAGIPTEDQGSHLPQYMQDWLAAIETDWRDNLSGRPTSLSDHKAYFDSYLYRKYGYSLMREAKKRQYEWRQLDGYNRDTATVFSRLRQLLPEYEGLIEDGTVRLNDLHYEHPLLLYWPGERVTARISQEAESRCWIYLDNEVLCEARARELQRRDGSYRDNRIR
jgi:hypothetical protein